ncbi:hypothetical protein ABIB90_007651 [Bradyrhizobium sp. JR4.1]
MTQVTTASSVSALRQMNAQYLETIIQCFRVDRECRQEFHNLIDRPASFNNQSFFEGLACGSCCKFWQFTIKPQGHSASSNGKSVSILGRYGLKSMAHNFSRSLNSV